MGAGLTERIAALAQAPPALDAQDRADVLTAFADTLACAHAGWHEPVARVAAAAWHGGDHQLLDGTTAPTAEHAALITATAGHALDYDDVHLDSTTHPSVVIVPALLAMQAAGGYDAARLALAFAIGIAVNSALGRALGFAHYRRGWHATSTVGPLAGAAALAHLMGSMMRDAPRAGIGRCAVGRLAAACAMAKPAQAGFAAAAAVRAAIMAAAGLTWPTATYSGRAASWISMRATGAARCRPLLVPAGGMQPLRTALPRTGGWKRNSRPNTIVAVALWRGAVGLADFEDEAARIPKPRPAWRA